MRRWKLRHPELYREKAGTADAVGGDEYLSAQQLPFDFMLNALRLNEGVPLPLFGSAHRAAEDVIVYAIANLNQIGFMAS